MSIHKKYLLLLGLILLPVICVAQYNPDEVCRVDNGKIIYRLDRTWTVKQKHEVSVLFALDSLLMEKAFSGVSQFSYDKVVWNVKEVKQNIFELSRPIDSQSLPEYKESDVLMLVDEFFKYQSKQNIRQPDFGVNKFTDKNIFSYEHDVASLFLPGYRSAKKVFLAGSFNDWDTKNIPMQKSDAGWTVRLKLPPGKYYYKFIVDGKWMLDPFNRNKEDIGDGKNSFFFCENYKFMLRGHQDRKRVYLAGNFNSWNPSGLPMNKTAKGWELPAYLKEGTYFYKFVADNEWMTDPDNKNVRRDAFGNLNSCIETGNAMIFRLEGYQNAKTVVLSGTFNGWSTNELVMKKSLTGWELWYSMAPGNYEYKFIVDGKWMPDPDNPVTTGSGNFTNSFLAFEPNHVFRLGVYPLAKEVIVTGSFNKWNPSGYRMQLKNGEWFLPIYLAPGKYTYKFIVDGKWILDPENELREENEYGTGNSVLWITP